MQEELGKGKHLNEEHCILHALGESRVQVHGVGRKPSINNHLIPNQHYKPSVTPQILVCYLNNYFSSFQEELDESVARLVEQSRDFEHV